MYQTELNLVRSARARTLAMIAGLTQAQMDFSPAPGKWSIGELVDHLLLSEQLYREQIAQLIELKKAGRKPVIKRSFADINVSVAFLPRPLLPFLEIPFTLLNWFTPSIVRETIIRYKVFPAQTADRTAPCKGRPAEELREELRASLTQTEALFEAHPGLDYREMISQHPLLGANNALQLLRIVANHEQRHQDQISTLLATKLHSAH
jgi:uncharacterized damage-inducible protein DinB